MILELRLHDFDLCVMPCCASDLSITGHERCVQYLSERHICRVISRECRPEVPDAWNQEIVGVAVEPDVDEIRERFLPPSSGDHLVSNITA